MEENQTPPIPSESENGLQTLFGVSGRNQLELISIADNKANMITAICVALIFLIICLFGYASATDGFTIMDRVEYVLPLGILLAFSCVSAICAIMALKPKIIHTKKEGRSALFFNNYYRKTLAEYKTDMYVVMSSRERIYDHMLTDMYYNGLVLQRKYALLGYAYTIFLLAIVCSITSYVIATVS
jgi:Family of unknown function (DUF5706)